ncbi:MAG: hypothetical protein PHW04_18125, partial [Candidatus Wallbacteria bacterium]|nr:hypothetical protein [Candidatus Wallbacteria bacterium]
SSDTTDQELENLRQVRAEQVGRAKVSREVSGMDPNLKKERRLSKILNKKFSDEFSALVQSGKQADGAVGSDKEKSKVPEK